MNKFIDIKDYVIVKCEDEIINKEFNGKYGNFIVNGMTNICSGQFKLFECEFLYNNYKGLYRKDHILNGAIKNPYFPNIYNVACLGNSSSNHFLCGGWRAMIGRCYNKNSTDYKYYGGNGVIVCDNWLCFEYYIKDVILIDGYDEILKKENKIELDKDISKNKIYDKLNTIWIPSSKNKEIANIQQINNLKTFEAIRLIDGYVEYGKSKKAFSNKYNLHNSAISRCLSNTQKSHKGWIFKYEE